MAVFYFIFVQIREIIFKTQLNLTVFMRHGFETNGLFYNSVNISLALHFV